MALARYIETHQNEPWGKFFSSWIESHETYDRFSERFVYSSDSKSAWAVVGMNTLVESLRCRTCEQVFHLLILIHSVYIKNNCVKISQVNVFRIYGEL